MAPPSPPLRHVAPVVALAALCLACDGGGAPGGDPHHRDAAMIHGPDHYAWYWGDLHAHTGLSADGVASDVGEGCKDCGAVATVVEDARDTYHLDFLALTEHGNGHHRVTDLAAWDQQLADLLAADDPAGGFVTVPGIEVWTWHEGGNIRDHRNLYFFGEEAELDGLAYSQVLPPDDQAPMTGDDCEALYDWVADLESLYGPVLWLPHHPALEPPASTEWDCIDLHYSPAVENYSQHGNSQTPSAEDGWDPVWSNEVPGATVDAALARQGFALELGILGGTDSHNTRPGSINEQDPQFAHYDLSYGGSLTAVQWSPEEPFDR